MRILISIFLIIVRFIVGVKIMFWLNHEFSYPNQHDISEIEFYLVFLIFDIWISMSSSNIEIPKQD